MATQQDIDNLVTSVNATSTALEILSVAHNRGGNLVKAEDVTRVSEKLVAMVTTLGEYTTRGP